MSEKITKINSKLSANAKQIEHISAVISMTNKINTALERSRFTIAHMKEIMNDDKHDHLSVFTIPFPQLSDQVDRIYLKRRKNSPIFAGKDCRFYYNQPLSHSWVNKEARHITTLLQIPIAPKHQSFKLVVLNKANQLHPDLSLAIVNADMNYYRLMTLSDYDQCLTAENSIICQKREIMILPKVGCSLKQNNCDECAVHDITNSKILISLRNETNATLSCDNADTQKIVLPRKTMITLGIHCQLQTLTFLITKLSYRHLRELDLESTGQVIDLDLEHEALMYDMNADVAISKKIEGHSGNITELMRRNEEIRLEINVNKVASISRWKEITAGRYSWEQIALWALIGILGEGLLSSLTWISKLQIAAWKATNVGPVGGGVDVEQCKKEQLGEIKAQIEDMLTDARIQIRAITAEQEEKKMRKKMITCQYMYKLMNEHILICTTVN